MAKLRFELVSPERTLASVDADMVVVPGYEGDFGVLIQHSPVMSLLRPGVIAIYQGDTVDQKIFVGDGFAEVNEESCIVLAESATPVDQIDVAAAQKVIADARDDLGMLAADDEAGRAKLEKTIAIHETMIEVAQAA